MARGDRSGPKAGGMFLSEGEQYETLPPDFTDAKRRRFAFTRTFRFAVKGFTVISLFHSLISGFRSLGSHPSHPCRGPKHNSVQAMALNNWEGKYTKVITIFSSLGSFISTELRDKRVQKMGLPGLLRPSQNSQPAAYPCATPPSIHHGKVPTAARNGLYVQFPSPGKVLTSCFNGKSSWAASQAG